MMFLLLFIYLLAFCLYKSENLYSAFSKRVLRKIIDVANFQILKICGLVSKWKT